MSSEFEFSIMEYLNCPCEILTEQDTKLLSGKIGPYDENREILTVNVQDNGYSTQQIQHQCPIRLRIYTKEKREIIICYGFVESIGSGHWYIKLQDIVSREESRGAFRQPLVREAVVRSVEQGASPRFLPCQIVNISISGIGFYSSQIFAKEEYIEIGQLEIIPGSRKFTLLGSVRRIQTDKNQPDIYFYGCAFDELDLDTESDLYHDLFALQVDDYNQKR